MKKLMFFASIILLISIFLNLYLLINKKVNLSNDNVIDVNLKENIGTGKNNPNINKDNLENVLENKEILFSDYYSQIKKKQKINIFEVMYDQFSSVKDLEGFKLFIKEFSSDSIFPGILKNNDKALWSKYWSFLYDYYIENGDEYFENDLEFLNKNQDPKLAFLNVIDEKFLEIQRGITHSLSKSELKMDINVYFNNLPIVQAISNCSIIKDFKKEYSDINSCKDKIYFYRATNENKYCTKISDDYKKAMCNDFLEYQQKLK